MKEAASHHIESINGKTSALSIGLRKSAKNYKKEAIRFAKSLNVDADDIVKSFHRAKHSKEYEARNSNIIHSPINSVKRLPNLRESIIHEEEEGNGDDSSFTEKMEKNQDENIDSPTASFQNTFNLGTGLFHSLNRGNNIYAASKEYPRGLRSPRLHRNTYS